MIIDDDDAVIIIFLILIAGFLAAMTLVVMVGGRARCGFYVSLLVMAAVRSVVVGPGGGAGAAF